MRCRSMRHIGITWPTSVRRMPRCHAGGCWNPAPSMMRCCFPFTSVRHMSLASSTGLGVSWLASCQADPETWEGDHDASDALRAYGPDRGMCDALFSEYGKGARLSC